MKKNLFKIGIITLMLVPITTLAKEIDSEKFEVVSRDEKYYKTTITQNKESNTIEISKEEYDLAKIETVKNRGIGETETTYKKLTTSILSNSSRYRYKAVLQWKNFPAVRSYDVIGIGHYSNVKYYSSLNFSQTYCLTNGSCSTSTTHYPNITSTGVGASFKVPEGNLSSLSQTIFFDVQKNVSGTINSQAAYGDYSHATKTVSSSQSKKYSIGTSGIKFTDGIGDYYDDIPTAISTWNGNW